MVLKSGLLKVIGQFSHDGIASKTRVKFANGHWSWSDLFKFRFSFCEVIIFQNTKNLSPP